MPWNAYNTQRAQISCHNVLLSNLIRESTAGFLFLSLFGLFLFPLYSILLWNQILSYFSWKCNRLLLFIIVKLTLYCSHRHSTMNTFSSFFVLKDIQLNKHNYDSRDKSKWHTVLSAVKSFREAHNQNNNKYIL